MAILLKGSIVPTLMMMVLAHCTAAAFAEDYQPTQLASPQPAATPPAPTQPSPTQPAPTQYGAPYPSSSDMLQGGVEQSQRLPTPPALVPGYAQQGSGMSPGYGQQPGTMLPGYAQQSGTMLPGYVQQSGTMLPGYAQQSGTASGGMPYAPPRFGSPLQPRASQFPPEQSPLQGRAQDRSDGRPTWLPAYAYTNDAMVAPYHNMDIFFWDKRPIPNKQQWIRLSTSVSKYWRGYVSEPCMVLAVPMPAAPGNFTFQSQHPMGPRGWLQKMGTTNWQGFPMYRYWLDQR